MKKPPVVSQGGSVMEWVMLFYADQRTTKSLLRV